MNNKNINWNRYKYSEDQLREAVASNISARATLLSLGMAAKGGGYKPLIRLIKLLNIDTSHWLGYGHLKGKTHNYTPPRPLEEILKQDSSAQSYKLKTRIIKEGLLKDECSVCGIVDWHGQKLSLHLDHINGDSCDNRLENLRLLCPNCHSCTSTYCGRNKKNKRIQNNIPTKKETKKKEKTLVRQTRQATHKPKLCLDCNVEISTEAVRCKSCAGLYRNETKIIWPSVEELKTRVLQSSYLQVGKELGVSDNAIRKHIKNHSKKESLVSDLI